MINLASLGIIRYFFKVSANFLERIMFEDNYSAWGQSFSLMPGQNKTGTILKPVSLLYHKKGDNCGKAVHREFIHW